MNRFGKLAVVTFLLLGGVILVRHADSAMEASRPKDMPQDAKFVQTGFDLQRNEAKGEWIACSEHADATSDWCRVTDQRGTVVFQGDFMPVDSARAVPAEQLIVAANDPTKIWVNGPQSEGPVPVIRLVNGAVLVPIADQGALADRWASHPDELKRVTDSETN